MRSTIFPWEKRNYSVPSLCVDAPSFMRGGGVCTQATVNHGFENARRCAECAMLIISLLVPEDSQKEPFGRGYDTHLVLFKVLRTTTTGIIRGWGLPYVAYSGMCR